MPTIYEVMGLADGIEWSEGIYSIEGAARLHAMNLTERDKSAKYYVRKRNLQEMFISLKDNEEDLK